MQGRVVGGWIVWVVLLFGASGCKGTRPATEAPQTVEAPQRVTPAVEAPDEVPVQRAPARETPPGVKPHYVPCDPARPELPCTPDVDLEPPPELAPLVGDAVTELGAGRSEQAIRGCAADADCVVSCRLDGTCCLGQCDCRRTYNTAFFAELEAHQSRCIQKGCPKAKCRDMGYDLEPVCRAGLCAVREAPR